MKFQEAFDTIGSYLSENTEMKYDPEFQKPLDNKPNGRKFVAVNTYGKSCKKDGVIMFSCEWHGKSREILLEKLADILRTAGLSDAEFVVGHVGGSGHSCGQVNFTTDDYETCHIRFVSPTDEKGTRDNGRSDEVKQMNRIMDTIRDDDDFYETGYVLIETMDGVIHKVFNVLMSDRRDNVKTGKDPRADLILCDIDGRNIYISCKKEKTTMSGKPDLNMRENIIGRMIHHLAGASTQAEPSIANQPEVKRFIAKLLADYQKYGMINGDCVCSAAPVSRKTTCYAFFGNDWGCGEYGINNVHVVCVGNIDLIAARRDENGRTIYHIHSSATSIWQETVDDVHESLKLHICASYSGSDNSYGVKNCRVQIVPAGKLSGNANKYE